MASQFFDLQVLHWAAKPMLVIFLASYYRQNVFPLNKTFFLALSCCWVGDILLMVDQFHNLFFLFGLSSFLVAHVLLIFSYRQFSFPDNGQNSTLRVRLSFFILLIGSGLVTILYPTLGALKIPVMVYTVVLALMVLQAIFRLGRTSATSFWLVFTGAVFFLLSDSLLAINRFYQPIFYAGVWIMLTYMAALYLIVKGVVAHPLADKAI